MNIGFTGHRDAVCHPRYLDALRGAWPDATWIHGAAVTGFDVQVAAYAAEYSIHTVALPPRYQDFPRETARWAAPYARNREIVKLADIMVACYDGRTAGGTYYTIRYAESLDKPVYKIRAYEIAIRLDEFIQWIRDLASKGMF